MRKEFMPGERVAATMYGERRTGTVIEHRGGIVVVAWDRSNGVRCWAHDISLERIPSEQESR